MVAWPRGPLGALVVVPAMLALTSCGSSSEAWSPPQAGSAFVRMIGPATSAERSVLMAADTGDPRTFARACHEALGPVQDLHHSLSTGKWPMWAVPQIIPVMIMVGAVSIDLESCTQAPHDTPTFVDQMTKDIGTEKAARNYARFILGLPSE